MKKKITCGITGHTGSIGKNLIKNKKNFKFFYFKRDITKKKEVENWVNKNNFDLIIHLAAIVPIKLVNRNKKMAFDVNVTGTKNLVDSILKKKKKIKWFFFASTSHVYSSSKKKIKENFPIKPITYYGKTKYLGEKQIKRLKLKKIKFCIGRIFSTTNSNQRKNYLVPDLKKKIKNSKKQITLENLNHYRDFISVDDIGKIILNFSKKEIKGTVNIASGKKTKLTKIAKIIGKKYKKKVYFKENNKSTYLIANNNLLKKNYKFKIKTNIKDMIFE